MARGRGRRLPAVRRGTCCCLPPTGGACRNAGRTARLRSAARSTSTPVARTAPARSTRSPPRRGAPGCSSSSSPTTAMEHAGRTRRRIATACSASTPSKSAPTVVTSSRWVFHSRRIRSAGKSVMCSRTCAAGRNVDRGASEIRHGRSCAGRLGRRVRRHRMAERRQPVARRGMAHARVGRCSRTRSAARRRSRRCSIAPMIS